MFSRQRKLFEGEEGCWDDGLKLIEAVFAMAEANGGVIRSVPARKELIEQELLPGGKKGKAVASRRLYQLLSRSESFVRVRHGEYRLVSTYRPNRDLTREQSYLLRTLRGDAGSRGHAVASRSSTKIGF